MSDNKGETYCKVWLRKRIGRSLAGQEMVGGLHTYTFENILDNPQACIYSFLRKVQIFLKVLRTIVSKISK